MIKLPNFKKVLLILFSLVLFLLAIEGAYLFGFQRGEERKLTLENKVVRVLPLEAFGKVTKIENRQITVESEGDSFTFLVGEDTKISRHKKSTPEVAAPEKFSFPITEKITLKDVKVGDQIFAFLERTPEGKYVAQTLVIQE